jgi:hypothetical protein
VGVGNKRSNFCSSKLIKQNEQENRIGRPAASPEPTHVGELPGGVAPERGGRVAPVAVAEGERGRVRRLAPTAAASGAGPDERAQAHGEPGHPVPAAGAVPAPVLLLPGRRRRGEPPAGGGAAAPGGLRGLLLVRQRRRAQGHVQPALASDDRGEPRRGPSRLLLRSRPLLLLLFPSASPPAEDRGQEGPPPPRDLPVALLLGGRLAGSGADLRRAEEGQAGLVRGRDHRARVGAPARGDVGRHGAREPPGGGGFVALLMPPRGRRAAAAGVVVRGRRLVALGGEREEAVAEAGRADAAGVGVGVELAPHRRAHAEEVDQQKLRKGSKLSESSKVATSGCRVVSWDELVGVCAPAALQLWEFFLGRAFSAPSAALLSGVRVVVGQRRPDLFWDGGAASGCWYSISKCFDFLY